MEPHKQFQTPERDPAGLSLCVGQLPKSPAAAGTGMAQNHLTAHGGTPMALLCLTWLPSRPSVAPIPSQPHQSFWGSSASCKGLSAVCRVHVPASDMKEGCLCIPGKAPSAAGIRARPRGLAELWQPRQPRSLPLAQDNKRAASYFMENSKALAMQDALARGRCS